MATGFAIIEFDKILVETVSPTRRAAIVNFLVGQRDTLPIGGWTDQDVEDLWLDQKLSAECISVVIRAEPSQISRGTLFINGLTVEPEGDATKVTLIGANYQPLMQHVVPAGVKFHWRATP